MTEYEISRWEYFAPSRSEYYDNVWEKKKERKRTHGISSDDSWTSLPDIVKDGRIFPNIPISASLV